MDDWFGSSSTATAILIAGCAVLLAAALALLVLWQLSARARRRESRLRLAAERERIGLRLALAEQAGRMRIVRELHEIAAHSMSVIVGQADGARYLAGSDPAAAGRSAGAVAGIARATLADLRRVMALVRDGEPSASVQPGLKALRELFEDVRERGLAVEFEETGKRFEPGQGVELTVYRILHEALSNCLKHGGAGTLAKVSLTWTAGGLQVLVEDDGERAAAKRAGIDPDFAAQHRSYTIDDDLHALTGTVTGRGMSDMRERTELFGGVFNAYPVPGVGFTVSSIFPALRSHNGVNSVRLERA